MIMRYHPAAGPLWRRDQLPDFREQWQKNPSGWARAFGNQRDEGVTDRVIDADLWAITYGAAYQPERTGRATGGVRCRRGRGRDPHQHFGGHRER